MTDSSPATVTVYSDYVCPFCYLGRESLERYLETRDEALEIEWHPFDLRAGKRNPDGSIDSSVDDGKDDDYYAQAKANVERLSEQYDVEMHQPLATEVDSLSAQVVSYFIEEHYPYETWLAFDEAVFEALWEAGRDIGDPDVLVDLATDLEVPEAEIRAAIEDESLREDLEAQFRAAQEAGVRGVPTFVYGEHAARGAVPPAQLSRLIEGV
ncbi:DsbA family oxidoreductase [Halobacteria archaeon AArc-curdl1]|uniref:DsbA family oxidoreductase n=1 Tax=Natronosalvus hydrolyticus TaxID=2979988 RepID=A0AAP2ZBX7_9EURY|nr:DsbA family oxidoreductase [Halobacteria archaeon AArc-curdl1]